MGWKIPRGHRSIHRNLAQEFIQRGIRRGMRNTEIVNALRENGLSYRRQTMFQDVNGWREALAPWDDITQIGMESVIPEEWYIESNRHLEANYETVVKVRTQNVDTGEIAEKYMTILHTHETPFGESMDLEQILTPDDIKQRALDRLSTYGNPINVIDINIEVGYKRANMFD